MGARMMSGNSVHHEKLEKELSHFVKKEDTILLNYGYQGGSGSSQITINPSIALDDSTEFYLIIDATAFDDAAGNSYAGIDNTNSMLNFTSIDNTNPTLSSSVPVDNATGVSAAANITLTFSEAVNFQLHHQMRWHR